MSEEQAVYRTRQQQTSDNAFDEYAQMNEDNLKALIEGESKGRNIEALRTALRAFRFLRVTIKSQNETIEKIKKLLG